MTNVNCKKHIRSFLALLVALSGLWAGVGADLANAQSNISVEPGGTIVTVPANGQVSISIIGFCGDLDDAFPHFVEDLGPIGAGLMPLLTRPIAPTWPTHRKFCRC